MSAITQCCDSVFGGTGELMKAFIPYIGYLSLVVSIVALSVALWDRRPRLLVRARKGKWTSWRGNMLAGIVEVYNNSSRTNTISGYKIAAKDEHGEWNELESERYEERYEEPDEGGEIVFNQTPVVLEAFSGAAIRFGAFAERHKLPQDLTVRVAVLDLSGKAYSVTLKIPNLHVPCESE